MSEDDEIMVSAIIDGAVFLNVEALYWGLNHLSDTLGDGDPAIRALRLFYNEMERKTLAGEKR